MRHIPLNYFDTRCAKIDMIIIHAVAHDIEGAMESFHRNKVSAHYIIDEKGKIFQLVNENKRAWHAGVSFWQGKYNLNHNSIGIELCSKTLGQTPYPLRQIKALIRLVKRLKRKYHIKKENILGHSDVAPTRKADPGKDFPWMYLSHHTIGMWYNLKDAQKIQEDDDKELLSQIGYDTTNLVAAKYAFMRHFMGKNVKNMKVSDIIERPYEDDTFFDNQIFKETLKAVAYRFKK